MPDEEDERSGSHRAELRSQVYAELHALAAAQMSIEHAGHTLQPTALVHEAWLRLQGCKAADPANRALFFRAAAESMRRILIDHARSKNRIKRGGGKERQPMNIDDLMANEDSVGILAVDEAIQRIAEDDFQAGEVIQLRFFAGLTVAETAEALGISERSVHREWAFARARLAQLLEENE